MRDKRDNRKKRFIEALTLHGTVYHSAQAAGISRQTDYRWRHDDLEFAEAWDDAIENAVDQVESTIFEQAVGGNTLAAIFYLKAHRPIYRDRLNVDIKQVQSDIDDYSNAFDRITTYWLRGPFYRSQSEAPRQETSTLL